MLFSVATPFIASFVPKTFTPSARSRIGSMPKPLPTKPGLSARTLTASAPDGPPQLRLSVCLSASLTDGHVLIDPDVDKTHEQGWPGPASSDGLDRSLDNSSSSTHLSENIDNGQMLGDEWPG
ncbi:hypothetical protein ANO14919_116820 [Xylariales sp. No.14919]|nr:hypothetical protein ANO14919_116820 [Xylariales sp. No.14919]